MIQINIDAALRGRIHEPMRRRATGRSASAGQQVEKVEQDVYPKPLRTVFFYSAGHMGSAIVLNAIRHLPALRIVGTVRGGAIPPTKDGRARRFGLEQGRRIGLRYAATLVGYGLAQRTALHLAGVVSPLRKSGLVPCRSIARERGWRQHECAHVNSPETIEFVRALSPDLVVAAYFGQIVDRAILAVPRLGILNLHPGWLPTYRGAMSYVWTLAQRDAVGGTTLHWMDEGIDTGPILARRRFPIAPDATVQSVMVATALHGADLIAEEAARLASGERPEPIDVSREQAAYYPTPKLGDVENLLAQGRYYRIGDIAKVAWHGVEGCRRMVEPASETLLTGKTV